MSAIIEAVPDVDTKIDPKTVGLRIATEFVAVLFQLICFSRLGPNDYYYVANDTAAKPSAEPSLAANLVLLVTLVIFQFPFMNAYILFMYDTCVIGRPSGKRFLLCFVLAGVQLLAAWVATLCIHAAQQGQQPWRGAITWMAAGKKLEALDQGRNLGVDFLEEFVAVTALLVGYIHLTYYNFQYGKEPKLFRSPTHHFSKIEPVIQQLPIPLPFILQVTLLVAGLLRAFPTAHLSPHVSVYIVLMGYTTDGAFGFRIFGGVAGFVVSYVLFWGFYVERTGVHPKVKWFRTKKERRYAVGQPDRTFNARVAPVTQPAVTQPAEDELRTRHSAISFNNAYRYAYHAI
jgi:hypothetical protein